MKTSTIESKGLTSDIIDTIQNLVSNIPWPKRRLFMAEVTKTILDGKKRAAEDVFGWARKTVTLGLKELETGFHCEDNISYRHRRRIEDKHPKMLLDIQKIMRPESQAQSSLRTPLLYTNKTAASVRSELLAMGWSEDELPCVRTISNLLNRQNYRLRRVEKAQVQKKNELTDLIFENVNAVNLAADNDPEAVRISLDTKATIKLGDYSRGGKSRGLEPVKALDHDMNPTEKLSPGGILEVATGKSFLFFTTSCKTSDFIADGIELWWDERKDALECPKRLVINMDNGPECGGRRSQFLHRMVEFSDKANIEVKLAYYPPYHSKYNSIEHYWGGLERSWNGYLLDSVNTVISRASNFFWRSVRTMTTVIEKKYEKGVKLSKKEKAEVDSRIIRSDNLPFYDITIKPKTVF